jgi:hypothetical protein
MTLGKELWGDDPSNNLRPQKDPKDEERQQCVRALRNVADEHSTPSSASPYTPLIKSISNQSRICARQRIDELTQHYAPMVTEDEEERIGSCLN